MPCRALGRSRRPHRTEPSRVSCGEHDKGGVLDGAGLAVDENCFVEGGEADERRHYTERKELAEPGKDAVDVKADVENGNVEPC